MRAPGTPCITSTWCSCGPCSPMPRIPSSRTCSTARRQWSLRSIRDGTRSKLRWGAEASDDNRTAACSDGANHFCARGSNAMKVKELLGIKGLECFSITSDQTLLDAAKQMNECNIGALLVMNKGSLVGIITERDIVKNAAKETKECKD